MMDIFSWLSSLPWDIISAAAALIILLIMAAELVSKLWEFHRLKKPVEAHFVIPTKERYKLGYVEQDDYEHWVDTIVVSSNATVPILIRMEPKLNFYEDERWFGCEGKREKKPSPMRYFNPFVVKGPRRETSPEENPSHYRDWNQYYHIKGSIYRTKDDTIRDGFKLKTREEGEFEARLRFHTPRRRGMVLLTIKVEDRPSTEMYCIKHRHYLRPKRA